MRIAALYDIHGNLPALEAVLAEVRADLVVVGGDVVAGPLPVECLDALAGCGIPVRWVMGNADREVLAPGDGDSPAEIVDRWAASQLTDAHRALIASFEPVVAIDGVLFCHGSPRSDVERMTRLSPADRLRRILADVDEKLIVCGHTHQQFDRTVDRWRVVNAGSVGMPYEGRAAAFWALIDDGVPALERTDYDIDAAVAVLRASGLPDIDELVLRESLLDPADPAEVTAFLESGA
jgi:putative phosphoesterase